MGIQVNEIFESIDGEGIRTGYLVTFIRTQFCNLKCDYCDTKYSWDACDDSGEQQYTVMTVDEIIDKCFEFGHKKVTFTGGEPLIQKEAPELVAALLENGFEVNIETNGAVDLREFENKMVSIVSDHMKSVVDEYVPEIPTFEVFISPVFGSLEGSEIVEYMKEHKMNNVRVQVQLHKIFWDPATRGV